VHVANYVHVDADKFRCVAGEELIKRFESAPGSFRNFCRACSSTIPSKAAYLTTVSIPAGLFADDPAVRPNDRLAQACQRFLAATDRVVGQAKRFAKEIDDGVKRAEGSRQAVLEGLRRELESLVPLGQQLMRQTKARIFAGDTHAQGKIASLFEPNTEVVRKGKAGKAD
jgi:hypothetical protein